jgi:hypothetical protein
MVYAADAKKQPDKKTTQQSQKQQASEHQTIEDTFKKTFPQVPFDSIKSTDIKGIYEVSKGSELIYFISDPGYLFIGDIVNKEGKSITEQRKGELSRQDKVLTPG